MSTATAETLAATAFILPDGVVLEGDRADAAVVSKRRSFYAPDNIPSYLLRPIEGSEAISDLIQSTIQEDKSGQASPGIEGTRLYGLLSNIRFAHDRHCSRRRECCPAYADF